MVSKIIKKSPFKPGKDRRSRHRKKSPSKKTNVAAKTSVIVASINESLFKIFSKIARIGSAGTPLPKAQKNGYQVLPKIHPEAAATAGTALRRSFDFRGGSRLPPSKSPELKTIVLDLDETLIHSKTDPAPERFDFIVRPEIDGAIVNFYVQKRPGVDELLAKIAGRFEVVVFTAGLAEYASLVLDRLDRSAVISHRLYRDSCKQIDGRFVKDLSELGRDLRRVAIVDDNPNAYALQPENAIPIRPFAGGAGDGEMRRLREFLEGIVEFEDMRDAVKTYRSEAEEDGAAAVGL